jgi:hypothetical protein
VKVGRVRAGLESQFVPVLKTRKHPELDYHRWTVLKLRCSYAATIRCRFLLWIV